MSNFILILITIILSPVILVSAIVSIFIIYAVVLGIVEAIKKVSDDDG